MKDLLLYEKMDVLENNFPIKLISSKRYTALLPHWHEHYELLFFLHGECEAFCDGKKILVKAGDLVVSNSTQVHSFNSDGMVLFHALIVSPDLFSDIELNDRMALNHVPCDPFVKECFANLEDAYRDYKNKVLGSDMKVKGIVYSLFAHLFNKFSEKKDIQSEQHTVQIKRLHTVFNYISEHYHENLTTKDLADMCFVTESYFCRFFKKSTGMTLAKYITEVRIKKAQLLLENTSDGISTIAWNVGFDDANYFARTFRNTTGITPTQYRKKQVKV